MHTDTAMIVNQAIEHRMSLHGPLVLGACIRIALGIDPNARCHLTRDAGGEQTICITFEDESVVIFTND